MRDLLDRRELYNPVEIIRELIRREPSQRSFARRIGEDVADICQWKRGKKPISFRAVIAICRVYPGIRPGQLNRKYFPRDLIFSFDKKLRVHPSEMF